jgi:hypothetical protein
MGKLWRFVDIVMNDARLNNFYQKEDKQKTDRTHDEGESQKTVVSVGALIVELW